MDQYLKPSEIIDFFHPDIQRLAKVLSQDLKTDAEMAKACFIYVRDEIRHSGDHQDNTVTLKASDVLEHKTGWCYAKSHLLCALLRANGIPAGLCYQRLSVNENDAPYCLHGLNAVYLQDYGWYRVDSRGNKEGVKAEFSPPFEQLAFSIVDSNEADLPEIWAEPLSIIVETLTTFNSYQSVLENLPDMEL